MDWGKSRFNCWGHQGACARVILVLCECIWNATVISFFLPAFDDTSSLSSPPHQVVYPPSYMVPP